MNLLSVQSSSRLIASTKKGRIGQWLWFSLYSGRLQFQRSAVQIQPLANIEIEHFTVNCIEKTKIKKKVAGDGLFIKKTKIVWHFYYLFKQHLIDGSKVTQTILVYSYSVQKVAI